MKIKNILAMLFALIIIACSFSFSAYAAGDVPQATPEQMAEKLTEASFTAPSGYVLNYRIYRSSGYSPTDMEKPAMLILYFHGDDGKGDMFKENGLLGLLLADKTDSTYKDYAYIIVAPQCPEGESFASLNENGTFAENTPLLTAIYALVADIEATNIVLDKHLVMGVGTGATGAFSYLKDNSNKVSRLFSVGGECEADTIAQVYDAGIDFWCFAEENNTSIKRLASRIQILCGATPPIDFGGGKTLQECINFALNYDSPAVPEWVIRDAYTSRKFKVNASCTDGGKISAAPVYATYGSSANVTLTVNPGYIIAAVDLNGEAIDVAEFVQVGTSRQYKYQIENITAIQTLSVKLERFSNETSHGGLIDKMMLVLSIASAVLVVAAVAVYLASFYAKRKQIRK